MIRNGYVRAEQVIRDCLTAIETCRKRQLLGELPGDLEANAWAVLGSAAGSLGQNERSSEGYLRSSELYQDPVQRIAMYDSYLLSEHFHVGSDAAGIARFNDEHLAYNALFAQVRPLPALCTRELRARRGAAHLRLLRQRRFHTPRRHAQCRRAVGALSGGATPCVVAWFPAPATL